MNAKSTTLSYYKQFLMLSKKEIGNLGEEIACSYLAEKGHEIVERNWRYSRAELDIISLKGKILVFTEVKTRSYLYYGQPEDAITRSKEALIIDAAQRYMENIGHEWEIRFDIISVLVNKKGEKERIEHFEDAFFY